MSCKLRFYKFRNNSTLSKNPPSKKIEHSSSRLEYNFDRFFLFLWIGILVYHNVKPGCNTPKYVLYMKIHYVNILVSQRERMTTRSM